MNAYRAPLRDLLFNLREMIDLEAIAALPGNEEVGELAEPVLEEAAKFAAGVLDPLNASGDREGAHFSDGAVTMPAGFKAAFRAFAEAGWIGLPMPPEFGGQGLPQVVATAALEMWQASNTAFSNGPLLNQGAIEAILLCGTEEQKRRYVPNLVSGKWTGTMDLTEPQAGSDLAQVRTKAVPSGDGYRLTGQKIFITYGEHDYAENIVHLTLARTPNAPEGVRGISLFITPKFIVKPDGSLGERNDLWCAGIEHKLGIHASPTCTMNYGERGAGAFAELVGRENEGLKYMFIMMNAARFSVGVQGYAIADRAFAAALDYARVRVQSKDIAAADWTPVPIVEHPDVRRMLMDQKSQVEAMRALAFFVAEALDHAHANPDAARRAEAQALVEFLTPVVKAWSTESASALVSEALQCFGGMGYIEETGVAQYYRDVRIAQIYEGTTGIQANDLLGRKFLKDAGKTAMSLIARMRATERELTAAEEPALQAIAAGLRSALEALERAASQLGGEGLKLAAGDGDTKALFAGAVPHLMLWGFALGGWRMAKAAQLAARKAASDPFYAAKLASARYYAEHVLPKCGALAQEIVVGGPSTLAIADAALDADRKHLAPV